MLVKFEDKEYQFDLDEIDLQEARYIKRQTSLSLLKFQEGIIESDPDCLAAAYWLMLKQNGKVTDVSKVNFKVGKFSAALADAFVAEAERQAELDQGKAEKEPSKEPATT